MPPGLSGNTMIARRSSPKASIIESKKWWSFVRYKHGRDFSGGSGNPERGHWTRLVCGEASKGATTEYMPLALLLAVRANLNPVGHLDDGVLQRAVNFLQGKPLFVYLRTLEAPLMDKERRWLIQSTHLAHVLKIEYLQRAAMHALYTWILRRPEDWSDTSASRRLLEGLTTEGNPARRV
ncbi:uncharacterized protein A1O9_12142 [Exophiala aquamarina CBS 119918]|uniref:Uncharacterized protein n=1 Tax=Exophiala aquamarina CBS 119918 TaxID=1182545 RepID=A0A072P8D1_9EURO|nr:uncharacterized protein A1O9_12142 [Exophiala aquamarina CBS 119918]KEF51805.1 hypothetical protein A1O9_12142 [Exophiala aquamarina CBS 119918]